ncbi:SDR family NAD(P)-dependent oxidoreductase [Flexibacterium corallicola]|uniref:SDR family NAD(P)-dependent oxidoreductase n=1 Tax=Flexibacterium corallicola TaxID=3037259 RepID=UPI00286F98E7|nr:SDR family oxidoreductase [Pseudovibrio sp. M1P-2-3]
MKKNILIVGGTSGVGLELARHYTTDGHNVCITGRKSPSLPEATYQELSITQDSAQLPQDLDRILDRFENVHTLVYAAGFLQRGHIDELNDDDLGSMVNVGLLAPMMLIQRLKNRTNHPLKIMLITSSSQYTPREFEPAYCAAKSAMGMLGASLVRDKGLGKVLVAAPSGIQTPFWKSTDEDTKTMLDPQWVADQIVDLSSGNFKYKYAKILRDPARVEVVECLNNDLIRI